MASNPSSKVHLPSLTVVPARHYLQEDQAPVVAQVIAENARQA